MTRHVKDSGRFRTASGSFDVYVPFVEWGLRLLRADGRLGYIVPSRFLKADYGARLRALLAADHLVEEIIDFGDAQIFEDATNYTCILIADRRGQPTVQFRAVSGTSTAVRQELAEGRLPPAESYPVAGLGRAPWVLVPTRERAILDVMAARSARLDAVTSGIFTGLQTSADDVYIVHDLGLRGGLRRVRTRSGDVLDLEDDLLHPLASGPDVERYAFRHLRTLLLFPYAPGTDGITRLLDEPVLRKLPLTWAYLQANETTLRAREKGKMDHAEWWAYVYPKSLGHHVHPKLGVAATVMRLEVAADLAGAVHFHNVRVNGILPRPGGVPLATLAAILNARAVDYAFRRGSVPLANGHFQANKQFIAPLPIPTDIPPDLHRHGSELCTTWQAIHAERGAYLAHLQSVIGADPYALPGSRALTAYDMHTTAELLSILDKAQGKLAVNPRTRAAREVVTRDLEASTAKVTALRRTAAELQATVDDLVFDAYGLSIAQREVVDSEYD